MDRTAEFHQLCYNQQRRRPENKYEIEMKEFNHLSSQIETLKNDIAISKQLTDQKQKSQDIAVYSTRLTKISDILTDLRSRIGNLPVHNCHMREIKKSLEIFAVEMAIDLNALREQILTNDEASDEQSQEEISEEQVSDHFYENMIEDTDTGHGNNRSSKQEQNHFFQQEQNRFSEQEQNLFAKQEQNRFSEQEQNLFAKQEQNRSSEQEQNFFAKQEQNRFSEQEQDFFAKQEQSHFSEHNTVKGTEIYVKKPSDQKQTNRDTPYSVNSSIPSRNYRKTIPFFELEHETATENTVQKRQVHPAQKQSTKREKSQAHSQINKSMYELGTLLTELTLQTHIQGENLILISEKLKESEKDGIMASVNIKEKLRRIKNRRALILAILAFFFFFILLILLLKQF